MWRAIKTFLLAESGGVYDAEIRLETEDRLLDYLIGFINRQDLIAEELTARKGLKKISDARERELAYAKLYFSLEEFLVKNKPLVTKKEFEGTKGLREEISRHISVDRLSASLLLVFSPENEQAARISNIALPDLVISVRHNLGDAALAKALAAATKGTLLEGVDLDGNVLSLEKVASKINAAPLSEVTFAFKKVYKELIEAMAHVLGKQSATGVTQKMYETIAKHFDQKLLSTFLGIMPEGFLDSQKLFILSREELEKRVVEATEKLRELNEGLEEKVRARTRELTQANLHLQELDKVKSEFISVAAHQLRTPTTRIKWLLDAILKKPDNPLHTFEPQLAEMSHSTDQLISIINNLLDISRMEEGQWGIKMEHQAFDSVVREVYADFKGTAEAKDVTLSLALPDNLPLLDFDKEKISIVLNNLLDNAIKYTASGGRVAVEVSLADNKVVTSIRDTGIGIEEPDISRIFSKFYRAKSAQLVHTDGTGLGLFVSKKIVEYHHGEIGFDSLSGEGTTFHFSLPVAH